METVKDRKAFEEALQTARILTKDTDFDQFQKLTQHRILSCYRRLQREREKGDQQKIDNAAAFLEAWLYRATEKYY